MKRFFWYPSVALALALVVAGCGTPPRFAVRLSVPSEVVSIRSDSATDAARLAELVHREREYLLAFVPGTIARPLEVWRVGGEQGQRLLDLGADGLTSHRREMPWLATFTPSWWHRTRVLLLARAEDRVVTHELAHALLGPDWDPLPSALEEGLCDWLSFQRFPDDDGPVRHLACLRKRQLGAALDVHSLVWPSRGQGFGLRWLRDVKGDLGPRLDVTEVLQLPERTPWPGLSSDGVSHAYAVGFLLAERILDRHGLSGLLAACQQATARGESTLQPETVLALADLPEGQWSLSELLQRHERAFLERALWEPKLIESLLELYEDHAPEGNSVAEFLPGLRGRLRLETRSPINWRDLPGFPSLADRAHAERERIRALPR